MHRPPRDACFSALAPLAPLFRLRLPLPAEQTLAIVLRVVEFSETSLVVTLFTRDFGKIGALAKGARRPKSPFEAALDLAAVCRIVFLPKSGDALDLLTEAKLERRFRAGQRELARLYAGLYVVELLDQLTEKHDPHPELFDAARQVLGEFDGQAEVASTILRFELAALRLVGQLPELAACVGCGQNLPGGERVTLGLLSGGVLCGACRAGQRGLMSVSGAAIEALRRLAADDCLAPRQVLEPQLRGETRGVMDQYMAHLLGRPAKLRAYLGEWLQ